METLYCIFILLLIIQSFILPFLKTKKHLLYCGLIGFAGWDKPDLNKLKIIFFANETRGRDSCGYYYNNFLEHGIGTISTPYKYFQANIINNLDVENYVFIGHTRQGTVGAATMENAHPFNIDNRWIVAHNGTLDNWRDLCNKYGLNSADFSVDSKALGKLIDIRGFDILNEYRGYAALLMTNIEEPNVLYAYHGASKKYAQGEVLEERPLFCMETGEGVYFSSLREPLDAIRDDAKQEVKTLAHNKVYRFEHGVSYQKNSFLVSRETNNVGIDDKKTYYQPNFTPAATEKKEITTQKTAGGSNGTTGIGLTDGLNVFLEFLPKRASELPHRERVIYYRNQHWISDNGKLYLADGEIFLDKQGLRYAFKSNGIHSYHFLKGYLFESADAAHRYSKEVDGKSSEESNFAFFMSKYSRYAVVNQPNEGKSLYSSIRYKFFVKGKPANTSIKPLFSDRTYVYREGYLTRIDSDVEGDITLTPHVDAKDKIQVIEMFPKKSEETAQVDKLFQFMQQKWISSQQLDDDLPPEVKWAVHLYIHDMFSKTLTALDSDAYKTELQLLVKIFFDDMLRLRSTIAEHMIGGEQSPKTYLLEAIESYQKDEEEDDDEEDVDDDIEEVENDRIIKDFGESKVPALIDLADSLAINHDDDDSQQKAFDLYSFTDMFKKELNKEQKKSLVEKINTFK